MQSVLLYISIISLGFLVAKKRVIPEVMKNKVAHFQTAALFFLLGAMGYKIGADDEIIKNFSQLGVQAIIVTLCTIFCSIAIVFIIYNRKKGGKE